MPPMLDRGHHVCLCSGVAGELVRDHDTRGPALLFQQLAEQALGGLLVPPALDQDVEHDPILVNSPPEPVLRSPDPQAHFVEVTFIARAGQPAPDLVGEALADLARPLPHGFMAHLDAAGGQHLFHHAQAQRKAEVEPHGVADDLAWKAVAGVGGLGCRCHAGHLPVPALSAKPRPKLTVPAGEMVRVTDHESISGETVRRRLAENELKPWREKMWCVPKIDGAYVARMEDVLDLYAEPPDPARPVVCPDESPVQLIGAVRKPIPAAPGQVARVDYEYCRNGTVNLFVAVDAHRSWRKVSVTERRTARDYAERLRELVDVDDPDAACIRVVQDNLCTHTPGSLYETFPAAEAHRILEWLEFHYTPKHASWLNMVEIEIGVLKGQCLHRRIDNRAELEREIAAWERARMPPARA